MKNCVTIIIIMLLFFSCSHQTANRVDMLCNRVNEITILPFKGEYVNDDIYNGLLDSGSVATKCLAEKITDTTIMKDPRKSPPYDGVTVGDVALFVILDITRSNIEEIMPAKIRKSYEDEGIYAYFNYVKAPENRAVIQKNVYTLIEKM